MKLILVVLTSVLVTAAAQAQNVTITVQDLQNFRKAVADADYWEKTAHDKEDQIKAANDSVASWKGLYLSEKDRADRVQGGRIDEIKDANTDLKRSVDKLEAQAGRDRDKISEQNAEIIGLQSSRKWYAFTGGITGAVVGFFGGRQTCGTSIPGFGSVPSYTPIPRTSMQDLPDMFKIKR
jgi:hypothetical protein